MVHHSAARGLAFSALADPTRRGVLDRLGDGDKSVTELAAAFGMTLTGMQKHIRVLESAGLVATRKAGRVRTCGLGPRELGQEAQWIEHYRQMWATRFDALDDVIEDLKRTETNNG
jgi:DNA-binding transcriptional ArsR family regulator